MNWLEGFLIGFLVATLIADVIAHSLGVCVISFQKLGARKALYTKGE